MVRKFGQSRARLPHAARRSFARAALRLRGFGRDAGGIAAVEFGFVAPILLVMLLGAIELTRAISIDRRFSQVTTTIADLVTREQTLTADDVAAIYTVAAQIMRPYDVSELKLSIIPVKAIDATTTVVYPATTNRPSYNGGSVPPRCASYPLTQGMLTSTTESVIVVEGVYTFTPLFAGTIMNSIEWKQKAYARPRRSTFVNFGDQQGNC